MIPSLLVLQMLNRPTYNSVPPLMLTKELEIRGPYVQRPWMTAIWGSRLALTPDDGADADMVLLFDLKTGSYLGQLARRGCGPGEIRMVRVLRVLSTGELLTVDVGNARIAWWTSIEARPRKEQTIVGTDWFDAVPWRGDTVLFTARGVPDLSAGYPLHLSLAESSSHLVPRRRTSRWVTGRKLSVVSVLRAKAVGGQFHSTVDMSSSAMTRVADWYAKSKVIHHGLPVGHSTSHDR